MSEQQQGARSSTQTLGTGILVIMWITAIFIIVVLNGIKTQLADLNRKVSALSTSTSYNALSQHHIVDAKEGGTVVFTIERKPEPEIPDDMLEVDPSMSQPAEASE